MQRKFPVFFVTKKPRYTTVEYWSFKGSKPTDIVATWALKSPLIEIVQKAYKQFADFLRVLLRAGCRYKRAQKCVSGNAYRAPFI